MDGLEKIEVCAPTPRTCRVCATLHLPNEPHNKNSLYYMNWFYKKNGRFPTWEDAGDDGRQHMDRDKT